MSPFVFRPAGISVAPGNRSLALAARMAGGMVAVGILLLAGTATAEPLDLSSIYSLSRYVQCNEACTQPPTSATYEERRAYFDCVAACGAPDRRWEKNGVAPVSRTDLDLALLETMDAADPTTDLVCYRGTEQDVVVPGALCSGDVCEAMPECTTECDLATDAGLDCTDDEPGGPRCWWPTTRRPPACPDIVCDAAPTRSPAECSDADGDGLPAWLEEALGRNEAVPDALCGPSDTCGFDQVCSYSTPLGSGQCMIRACEGACTAFHLELVAQDDREVLVWVYYDFSPLPARVLDLNIEYDLQALILQDARPLPALTSFGKNLATSSLSDGTLRLSVYDTTQAWPIPLGPIVELVFQRTSDDPIVVGFDSDDAVQAGSIAPLQGDAATQQELTDDNLWGDALLIPDRASVPTTMRLWFDFENPSAPIGYANVPDGETLCGRLSVCANEPDEAEKAKLTARLDALQRGEVTPTDSILGVAGDAAYLDGAFDHLRMPVHYSEPLEAQQQSFSFATWFYTDGNSGDEVKGSEQVLYTHNAFNERTVFGFKLNGVSDTTMDLVFFDGDLLSKSPVPFELLLIPELAVGAWHHLGFVYDAPSGNLDIYVDGAQTGLYTFTQPPPAVQCPQFADGTDVLLHEEGEVLGGRPPEFIYTSVNRSNLYKVERMDLHGLASQRIIGDSQFSYRDADYSPILDRVVYSSNVSGDFEIWIANGDGSNRRQITEGFGDTARGIFARRPKWAPDGSAIVFESNIFDVLAKDNTFRRVYHIYYIEYDRLANVVAIPLESGATVDVLNYEDRRDDQTIYGYRLTSADEEHHHVRAHWLRGRYTDSAGEDFRGELVLDTSGPRLDGNIVKRLHIPDNIYSASLETVTGLGEVGQELQLIAAHRSVRPAVPEPIVTEKIFYRRAYASYEAENQFALLVTELPAPADPFDPTDPNAANAPFGGYQVSVVHAPSGYDPLCWDRNVNGLRDSDEDRNGDLSWDVSDCWPYDVRNLYVEHDGTTLTPILQDDDGNYITAGAILGPGSSGGLNKKLQLREFFPAGKSLVRVEVLSPTNADPIPGAEIASLKFLRKNPDDGSDPPFGTIRRLSNDEYAVKDLTGTDPAESFVLSKVIERIEEAAFSPDGNRLLVAGISEARPVLLVTDSLAGASGGERISTVPTRIRGLNWVRQTRYYACNWFGGYLHLQNKLILNGFRGGLDDLKIYSGRRDPDAFRSEAERGHERLRAEGRESVESRLPSCGSSHLECPPYHLCIESECVMVACDPTDPYACTPYGGRCTLRPTSAEQENTGPSGDGSLFDFVCATDCGVDRQCFTQTCLNGPCRFCEPESQTCIECREGVSQLGALTLVGIEGCPDRRSFACEAGACVTDCYAFEDGQSQYLCDPTLEYCDRGRCVLLDWDWWDFAPASFGGLGEMRRDVPRSQFNGFTQAVDQSIPIEINAYGVADYLNSPEVVVEVRGGPFYGSEWARIGRFTVHNKTQVEAQLKPYVLNSPWTFSDMRLRLVTDPATNGMKAATGLGVFDDQFCLERQRQIANDTGQPFDATPCYRAAQGSRYGLGYRVGIPTHEAIAACREHGRPGCPQVSADEHQFLHGGHPGVVVLEAKVAYGSAMNAITSNRVCPYEGSLVPIDGGIAKKIYYGDIVTEQSNQRDVFCAANPTRCANSTSLIEFGPDTRGFALLNCNVYDPVGASASVVFQNIAIVQEWPARAGPIVFDDGDTCTIEIDAARVIPCYEWMGSDVGADPGTVLGIELSGSLEFSLFRTFGHEEGFTSVPLPTWPLEVEVIGYQGGGLALANGDDVLVVNPPPASQTLVFSEEVKEGRRYDVEIVQQPSDPDVECRITAGVARGNMPEGGGVKLTVTCRQVYSVGGQVSGLAPGLNVTLSQIVVVSLDPYHRRVNDVINASNGGFTFDARLPDGIQWQVGILPPHGYRCQADRWNGTISGADVTDVSVECVEVPLYDLGVTVSGLTGSGLVVLERNANTSVSPTADGVWTFPTQLIEGDGYDLVIAQQPSGPDQACQFTSDLIGTMPGDDHFSNFIVCTDVPIYSVKGSVFALTGTGLELTLNGTETIGIPRSDVNGETVSFSFTTPMLEGDSFAVGVTNQPTNPDLFCQVLPESGIVEQADVDLHVACQPDPEIEVYAIGGTISGLSAPQQPGTGLKLALNGGTQFLLPEDNGAFVFPDRVTNDAEYDVTVVRQPQDPAQSCSVVNGAGTVASADVDDIEVICEPGGTVELRLLLPTSNGSAIRALLLSTGSGAQLVGEVAGATIESSDQRFEIVVPSGSDVAVLTPATYALYLFVNQNGSVDDGNGRPTWDPYDLGRSMNVTVSAGQKSVVTLAVSDLSDLVPTFVSALADGVTEDIPLACYWTPSGTGALGLPVGGRSPVIGKSARACEPDELCWIGGETQSTLTLTNEVIPFGIYDLTCWVDNNETKGFDSGDYVGTVTTPAGPATITLGLVP